MSIETFPQSHLAHAPAAWRGQSRRASLPSAVMKEVRQHPLQTLAFVAAGLAVAWLALAPRRHRPSPGTSGQQP